LIAKAVSVIPLKSKSVRNMNIFAMPVKEKMAKADYGGPSLWDSSVTKLKI